MGTTTHGLPYPDPADLLANTDLAIKALAEAMIGPLTTVTTGFTASTGWTLPGSLRLIKIGTRFMWLDIVLTRAAGAATLTAAANGNITDTDMCVFPAAFRPVRRQYLSAQRSSLGTWQAFLESNAGGGALVITAGPPTATIAAGDAVQVQALVEIA